MRTICNLFAAILVIVLNQPAYSASPYRVEVATEAGLVGPTAKISFETVEQYPSMCGRTTVRLAVELPAQSDEVAIPHPKLGRIAFDTTLLPETVCLMAFGPHRGGIELALGDGLPEIPDGYYTLVIDGSDYGYLFIHDEQAELVSDIPQ